jgi:hypothetical protein
VAATERKFVMSKEQDNKAIVGRWFKEFWGNPWNPRIIDELAAPDILLQYSLHAPRRGRQDVKKYMTGFREAFPDLEFGGTADLIAEGDYVVGFWESACHLYVTLNRACSTDAEVDGPQDAISENDVAHAKVSEREPCRGAVEPAG